MFFEWEYGLEHLEQGLKPGETKKKYIYQTWDRRSKYLYPEWFKNITYLRSQNVSKPVEILTVKL